MTVALGLLADRYELGELVGQGRSPVYRARDTRLGRDVALKRVPVTPAAGDPSSCEATGDVRTRARREARAAARVVSPHAVGIYDVVEEGDAVWLVMELVHAPSLERLVSDEGPLDEGLAARIGLDVLDALAAAHARGVVHRDVKPANVLVGTPVKLADFGIAALRDESGLTHPGTVLGSPSYMAPEQARGDEVGPAADLWALGALLYFAVEGEPPFAAGSALATAAAVVHSPWRPQRRPGRLAPVIRRLLAKDERARPDAGAVRRLLIPLAAGTAATAGAAAAAATLPGTAQLSRDAVTGPGGGDATLVAPAATPPSGRGRRRTRRLALAAALAVVVAGAAAAAGIASIGGDPSPPPTDTTPASSSAPVPAPGPAATTPTTAPGPATPGPAKGKAKGRAEGRAKGRAKGRAGGQADPATAADAEAAAAAATTTTLTGASTTESAPPDSAVNEPTSTTEAPAPSTPTSLSTDGSAQPPAADD